MSTLLSTDMNVTRSTTKRLAPPGGKSNFSIGGSYENETVNEKPKKEIKKEENNEENNENLHFHKRPHFKKNATSEDIARMKREADEAEKKRREQQNQNGDDNNNEIADFTTIKVGIINVESSYQISDLYDATLSEIDNLGVTKIVTFNIKNNSMLPYAVQRLIDGGCSSIICLEICQTSHWASGHLLSATIQTLNQMGLLNNIPIVTGFVFDSSANLKNSGKSFAEMACQFTRKGLEASTLSPSINLVSSSSSSSSSSSTLSSTGLTSSSDIKIPDSTKVLLNRLKASLKKKGANGIAGLARKFRILDDDGNGGIDFNEFKKCISEHSFEWSDDQIRNLFNFFDEDSSGDINYNEFLYGIRGELNDHRAQLVMLAFEIIDADKSGAVTVHDLVDKFDVSKHPDVMAGKLTEDEALRMFLDTFDQGEKDGKVTTAEFLRYYANISASIDDDQYFELMIRNAWHIMGGEGQAANSANRRVLVTRPDGTQTVEAINEDLGIKSDDIDSMIEALKSQGIAADNIELFGGVDTTKPPKKEKNDKAEEKKTNERPKTAPAKTKQTAGGGSSIIFG